MALTDMRCTAKPFSVSTQPVPFCSNSTTVMSQAPIDAFDPEALPQKEFTTSSRVIAIGTSAGGLDALKTFFDHVPEDCLHSFVVIQHLSPDYKSMMAELLSKNTELSIYEVEDGMPIEEGSIYLIPPKRNMTIREGRLQLAAKPRGHKLPLPIDVFFNSLAEDQGERAVAVVLTGTGSDGTNGIRAIKERGGMVLVQDPKDAAFDGMPLSAIRTGLVDLVLPVVQLPQELLLYLEHPTHSEPAYPSIAQDKKALNQILNQVRHVTGTDFTSYKRPTLARRIERRLSVSKCDSLQTYLTYTYENPHEAHELRREFLIGVTRFFRDPPAWESLQTNVLRDLVRKKAAEKEPLRVWSVACSTGDEVYSVAILLKEEMHLQGVNVDVKIFATDIDKTAIEIASQGLYSESIVSDVTPERINRYFSPKGEGFSIVTDIRKMAVFSQHNILQDPPFSRIDLVICRNMLIYLDQDAQQQAMEALHYATNLGGILMLGSSETVGDFSDVFQDVDRKTRIYRNVQLGRRMSSRALQTPVYAQDTYASMRSRPQLRKNRFGSVMNQMLVSHFGVVSIYVNETFEILEAVGPVRDYIKLPEEGYSFNLLKLLPSRLSVTVSTAARRAKKQQEAVLYKGIDLPVGDQVQTLDIMVRAFQLHEHSGPLCYIIVLLPQAVEVRAAEVIDASAGPLTDQQVEDLEAELKDTRENLQAMVEEVETSNEELQATNEELLAANEELQSTNEELQSMNEELHTVNTELHEKIEDFAILNADMDNLLKSTQIGTIFLDVDLRIRKYTPAIREQFSLREMDIGRPLVHFSSNFTNEINEEILARATQVLKTQTLYESEVHTRDDRWYLMRITPFFGNANKVDGVVLSFVDITKAKHDAEQLRDREQRLGAFVKALPGLAFILDEDGRYVEIFATRNELLYKMEDHLQGRTMHEVLPQEAADLFHQLIQDVLDTGTVQLVDYPLDVQGGNRWFQGQVAPMDHLVEGKRVVIWIAFDITDRKEAQEALHLSEQRFQLAVEGISAGIWDWIDVNGESEWWSPKFYELLDFEEGDLEPSLEAFGNLLHPDDRDRTFALVEQHFKGEAPFLVEYRLRTKSGTYKWFLGSGQVLRDSEGNPLRMVGSIIDIDERKQAMEALRHSHKELEQFAYITSHDLQEPLRTVNSFSKRMLADYGDQLDERATKYLEFLAGAASRMHTMIHALLTYSQIGQDSPFEPVDSQAIVETVVRELDTQITEQSATIDVGDLPTVTGNPVELQRLFQNLLTNALKFSKPDTPPQIHISSQKKEGRWQFAISDNGIGIETRNQTKVFKIFQRLHASSAYTGAGIGLAQCEKIVVSHGGTIWMTSEPGVGSTFYFTLPA